MAWFCVSGEYDPNGECGCRNRSGSATEIAQRPEQNRAERVAIIGFWGHPVPAAYARSLLGFWSASGGLLIGGEGGAV